MLHISASDTSGTAGRGAFHLHQALRKRGENSRMFVLNQEQEGPAILRYQPEEDFLSRISRIVRKGHLERLLKSYNETRPKGCTRFSDDRSPYGPDLGDQLPTRNIVHLHSVGGFVDCRRIFPLLSDRPVVWTLHDMNPFTGGCHHDRGCGRFREACGGCPQLGSTHESDLSRQVHQRKQKAFALLQPDLVRIVAVNSDLASMARESPLLEHFEISRIPYGIDSDVFRPRDRNALRAALDIPPSAFVVLFKATGAEESRTEMNVLIEVLQQISGLRNLVLLSAGDQPRSLDLPFAHLHLGHFTSDEMLSLFYSTGDCLVSASDQVTLDLSVMEAMACATPVVAFETAGAVDIVKPEETGLLARSGDIEDLARKIKWIKRRPKRRKEMGERSRRLIHEEFSVTKLAARYSELYRELHAERQFPARSRTEDLP